MESTEVTNRLKRIEGQIRGLQRMVETRRDCEAVLTQLMAARAALDQVALLMVEDYVQECVLDSDPALLEQRLGRVMELVFARFSIPNAQDAGQSPSVTDASEEKTNHDQTL